MVSPFGRHGRQKKEGMIIGGDCFVLIEELSFEAVSHASCNVMAT
jgi:hypothetical protein